MHIFFGVVFKYSQKKKQMEQEELAKKKSLSWEKSIFKIVFEILKLVWSHGKQEKKQTKRIYMYVCVDSMVCAHNRTIVFTSVKLVA